MGEWGGVVVVENTNQDWPFPLLVKIELSKSVKMGRHQQKKSKAGGFSCIVSCRVCCLDRQRKGGQGADMRMHIQSNIVQS